MSETMSYKELKEQWVVGHEGGSRVEIAILLTCTHFLIIVREMLTSWLYGKKQSNKGGKLFVDFSCLLLPQLVVTTVLVDYVHAVVNALVFMILALLLLSDKVGGIRKHPSSVIPFSWKTIRNIPMGNKRPFITNYRAYMNIGTAICILAVDFVVFPRRFCKAETYGTGLMDLGVGSFIISNAIVSPEARNKYPNLNTISQKAGSVLHSLWTSLPLWVLGFARFLAVKGSDYQEHVSEYGVHWNFFFTLAVVKVLSTVFLSFWPASHSWLLSVLLAGGYQLLLTGYQLNELALFGSDGQGTREGLLNANREGLFSSLGYLALYFAGVQLGRILMYSRSRLIDWLWCLLQLGLITVSLHLLLLLCESSIEPVSRRLANMQYCLWMMAINTQLLACYLLVDILCSTVHHLGLIQRPTRGSGDSQRSSDQFCLLEAINKNGLFFFLLANILTGLVNMTVSTLSASPPTALLILSIYLLLLSMASSILYVYNITLRL